MISKEEKTLAPDIITAENREKLRILKEYRKYLNKEGLEEIIRLLEHERRFYENLYFNEPHL